MAKSVSSSSLFRATAMQGRSDRPYRHRTDSEFADEIAMKQNVMGVQSPHPSTKAGGPPVKRVKK